MGLCLYDDDSHTQARETPIGWTTPARREGQAEEGKQMKAKETDLRALEAGASAAFMDFRCVTVCGWVGGTEEEARVLVAYTYTMCVTWQLTPATNDTITSIIQRV